MPSLKKEKLEASTEPFDDEYVTILVHQQLIIQEANVENHLDTIRHLKKRMDESQAEINRSRDIITKLKVLKKRFDTHSQ
jgi:hypothetical protein